MLSNQEAFPRSSSAHVDGWTLTAYFSGVFPEFVLCRAQAGDPAGSIVLKGPNKIAIEVTKMTDSLGTEKPKSPLNLAKWEKLARILHNEVINHANIKLNLYGLFWLTHQVLKPYLLSYKQGFQDPPLKPMIEKQEAFPIVHNAESDGYRVTVHCSGVFPEFRFALAYPGNPKGWVELRGPGVRVAAKKWWRDLDLRKADEIMSLLANELLNKYNRQPDMSALVPLVHTALKPYRL
ncbi:MAG: hypothetical protein HYT22_00700 [Candidatus Niyogibacteria bacterium]|nr:hypothetical protein [Candidatus Niyogibacteria bacterium]